jgi:CheY-like chemotaxis protein
LATRDAVAELLETVGYRVRTAGNGREAIAAIEHARPALVLLDLMMPIMSGWEVVDWIKCYGLVSTDQILVMSAAGALCPLTLPCVRKPFDVDDLLAEIRVRMGVGNTDAALRPISIASGSPLMSGNKGVAPAWGKSTGFRAVSSSLRIPPLSGARDADGPRCILKPRCGLIVEAGAAAGDDVRMRDMRQGLCSLCGHNEIIEASAADFVGDSGPTRPMSVTYEIGWAGVKHIGKFKTFVCRRCGFTQWFALAPESIPVAQEYGTRLLKGEDHDNGPYR